MVRNITRLVLVLAVTMASRTLAEAAVFLEARAGQVIARAQSGTDEPAMGGSYAVRIYRQTTDNFVTGTVSDREGRLAGLWLTDLNRDGELEVLVWNQSGGSGGGGRLDHYRLNGDSLTRDDLPPATPEMLTQYMGHDEFRVVDGKLLRSFPLYNPGDPNSDPTGGRRTLVYRTREGRWVARAPTHSRRELEHRVKSAKQNPAEAAKGNHPAPFPQQETRPLRQLSQPIDHQQHRHQ